MVSEYNHDLHYYNFHEPDLVWFLYILLHYRGHNWWKETCNSSLWNNSAAKLLKHMRHHLLNLKYASLCICFCFSIFTWITLSYFIILLCWQYWIVFEQVPGNENPSTLISFATKTLNAGQVVSKLHVIELGAQPGLHNFLLSCLPLLY